MTFEQEGGNGPTISFATVLARGFGLRRMAHRSSGQKAPILTSILIAAIAILIILGATSGVVAFLGQTHAGELALASLVALCRWRVIGAALGAAMGKELRFSSGRSIKANAAAPSAGIQLAHSRG